MGYGFMPSNELLRALGCRHDFDAVRGHLVTERNADCETSVAGVYAVGDCCGLGGARAAADEGLIAGAAVARALGRAVDPRPVAKARRALLRHRRFQGALWQVFAAPRLQAELARARHGRLPLRGGDARRHRGGAGRRRAARSARSSGARGSAWAAARAAIARPCWRSLLAERQGRPLDELAFFAPRVPAKPVAISDLVRLGRPRHDECIMTDGGARREIGTVSWAAASSACVSPGSSPRRAMTSRWWMMAGTPAPSPMPADCTCRCRAASCGSIPRWCRPSETLPFYPRAVRHWQAVAARLDERHRARRHRRIDGGGEPRAVRIPGRRSAGASSSSAWRSRCSIAPRSIASRPTSARAIVGAELCATEGKLNPLLANQAIRRKAMAAGVVHCPETRVTGLDA